MSMATQSDDSEDYMPELPAFLKKETPRNDDCLRSSPAKDRVTAESALDESQKSDKKKVDSDNESKQLGSREEWMNVPGKELAAVFGFEEDEKGKYEKMHTSKRGRKAVAGPPNPYDREKDEEIAKAVEEYNAIYRPKSLMEIHKDNIKQGKKPRITTKRRNDPYSVGSKSSSSFWERHSDLANPSMSCERRGDIIKKLSGVNNSFVPGSKRFN